MPMDRLLIARYDLEGEWSAREYVDFIYTQKESVTMQERSEGGLAMENNKKSLDEIYREVETDLKKGSFKGPKYEKIDIMVYGAGDQEANEANKADEN